MFTNQAFIHNLVGYRFSDLEEIKYILKGLGAVDPHVGIDSNPERLDGLDLELICCLDQNNDEGKYCDFTLFYIKDLSDRFYITEVNLWGF